MPTIIQTADIDPGQAKGEIGYWIYNGLDCCVTAEVYKAIEPQLDQFTSNIYAFERALQAPAMEMMLRGIGVDFYERDKNILRCKERKRRRGSEDSA